MQIFLKDISLFNAYRKQHCSLVKTKISYVFILGNKNNVFDTKMQKYKKIGASEIKQFKLLTGRKQDYDQVICL